MNNTVMGSQTHSLRLHLGCGLTTPTDWVNIDGSWNAWLAKYPKMRKVLARLKVLPATSSIIPWAADVHYHDLRKPLPFKANSVEAIYSSHTLEHLYYTEAERLLHECMRVLAPGGVIRLVVPDLKSIMLEYLAGTEDQERCRYNPAR